MITFGNQKAHNRASKNSILFSILFLGILILFLYAVSFLGKVNINEQKESLSQAIDRCIIQCYALEGTYPPSLSYMEEHYGLIYDKDTFFVDYQAIGSNLPPDVTILIRNGE